MKPLEHTQSFSVEAPYGSFECLATFEYWHDTLGIGNVPKEFHVVLKDWDIIDRETWDGQDITSGQFEDIENQLTMLVEDYARARLKLGAPVI